jgi:hypothetical protein
VRLPDLGGTVPNVASMRGQRLTVARGEFRAVHVLGLATGAGAQPVSSTFALEFADGTAEALPVTLGSWEADGPDAFGPLPYRHAPGGRENAHAFVHRTVVPIGTTGKEAVAVKLGSGAIPPAGSHPRAQLYVLAVALERADRTFAHADLSWRPPPFEPTPARPRPAPASPRAPGGAPLQPARFRLTSVRFTRAGARVRLTCTRPMRGSVRLAITRRASRRLGLRGRTTLARRNVSCATVRTVRLTPSRRVRRALRRPLRATLHLRMAAAAEPAQVATRRLKLRGDRPL